MEISMEIDQTERYIHINGFHADDIEKSRAFWRDITAKYPGYTADFCYRNCGAPVEFMREIGAVLQDSCIETRLARADFVPVPNSRATLVTGGNFAAFAELHDRANPDFYWSSERIGRDLSRWRIFTRGRAYVMMSLWYDPAEIFALEAAGAGEGAALLSAEAEYAFETGKTYILFMTDDDRPAQREAALAAGFAACGRYSSYRVHTL
ncbi:MAG: hypothetical protein FWF44_03425 [Defluviitaleaceae bacterium]|nr:hypothetical protein [Defluviitaleaceae bacterium]